MIILISIGRHITKCQSFYTGLTVAEILRRIITVIRKFARAQSYIFSGKVLVLSFCKVFVSSGVSTRWQWALLPKVIGNTNVLPFFRLSTWVIYFSGYISSTTLPSKEQVFWWPKRNKLRLIIAPCLLNAEICTLSFLVGLIMRLIIKLDFGRFIYKNKLQ